MNQADILCSNALHEKWIGKKVGALTVVGHPFSVRMYRVREKRVVCKCDCGRFETINISRIKRGKTKSCGCRASRGEFAKHGGASASNRNEYDIWKGMKRRCSDGDNPYYGGRGIKVCDRWLVFTAFLSDMGPRPSRNHSIDRIDPSGHYEPENCKWSTSIEQSKNKRPITSAKISLSAVAAALQVSRDKLYRKIRKGMSLSDAIVSLLEPKGTAALP